MKNYIVLIAFLGSLSTYAQGCSDAGFCSVGNSLLDENNNSKNQIDFGIVVGSGEENISYFSPYITYTRNFSESFSISSKLTYSNAKGHFGSNGELGDVFITGNYVFKEKNAKIWSSLLGLKIPLTNSNSKIKGLSVPLAYQASLGTYDLIAGIGLNYKKWLFNTALQLPLINNNKNSYFDDLSPSNEFSSTNLFERKPDVLFRTTYIITTKKKFTFKPNVLFIYHLGEDSFENLEGNRVSINGSNGLTLNGNLITSYALSSNKSLELSLASPFVVRKERPDGLTRSFTAAVIYKYAF